MDSGVEEEGILELGPLPRLLPVYRLQPRRERLAPLGCKRRHVREDSLHLLHADVTGEWHRIQASAADRRIGEQRIDGVGSFGPALGHQLVFHYRNHQPGVANLPLGYRLYCSGDDAGGRHGSAGAEPRPGERLDGGSDRYIAEWRWRRVDADILPATGRGDLVADPFG